MQLNLSNNFKSVKITCHFLIHSEKTETELKTKTPTTTKKTDADSSETNNLVIVCGSFFTLYTQRDATITLAISADIN